jgi:hypothetical protein
MDAQAAIADAQKREDTNKKRRERRSFAVYGVAGKPVIDKDAKRQENNKKKRDNRKIAKEAKRKKEEKKEASAFADNMLTPAIYPHV